jgi:sugar/nucleoside kinase (ribokinase family)
MTVLVVGSAHLDIHADRLPDAGFRAENARKYIGHIRVACGGTGLNVSSSLSLQGYDTTLLTIMNPNYLGRYRIEDALKALKIGYKIFFNSSVEQIFYLGHRRLVNGRLSTEVAICNDALVNLRIPPTVFEPLIENASHVVIGCNYTFECIKPILSHAIARGKVILLSGVGDQIVTSLNLARDWPSLAPIHLISLNLSEAQLIRNPGLKHPASALDDAALRKLCHFIVEHLPIEVVAITLGANGYALGFSDGAFFKYSAPSIAQFINSSGAGDAFLAALVAFKMDGKELRTDSTALASYVNRFVAPVLASPTSNMLNQLAGPIAPAIEALADRRMHAERRFSLKTNIIVSLSFMLIGFVLAHIESYGIIFVKYFEKIVMPWFG